MGSNGAASPIVPQSTWLQLERITLGKSWLLQSFGIWERPGGLNYEKDQSKEENWKPQQIIVWHISQKTSAPYDDTQEPRIAIDEL